MDPKQDQNIYRVLEMTSIDTSTPSKPLMKDISWSNVNFTAGKTTILKDCWGHVPCGKVCAILGPSGAGKSSLLNVLAGRQATTNSTTVSGSFKVGNQEINPVKFRKHIAYVMQDDALMITATPRECLRFSASMRLPSNTTAETIEGLVEKTLNDLGLEDCADVLVGGPLLKGISGGQRKRTSVGVEIITDPTLLFLDEPTSGLDSHSASNLVKLLRDIASRNNTVICTIHQPSSEVFSEFDLVIFMKSGRIFYQGPMQHINAYYADRGYPVPDLYNPADFVMNLCQTLEGNKLENVFMPLVTGEGNGESVVSSQMNAEELVLPPMQTSFTKQILAVGYREMVGTLRDTDALTVRFSTTILLNLLYGLIFLGAASKDNGNDVEFNAHVAAIMMSVMQAMSMSSDPILLNFPYERPMFLREYTTGTYGVSAYLGGKLIIESILTLIQAFIQILFLYFLYELQGDFFAHVGVIFGFAMSCNSFALMLGAACRDIAQAADMAFLLFVPQVLFMGLFVRISQIPVWLRWAQYLCSMSYATKLAVLIEFNQEIDTCNHSPEAKANCQGLIENNFSETSASYFWYAILCLFAIFLVARVLAGFILKYKARSFY